MSEFKDGVQTFYPLDRNEWRKWLEENHQKVKSVWIIMYKKQSQQPSVSYEEAVEEALCFGWIDSKPNKRDEESFYQFFSQRNLKSNWSKSNKERVQKLIEQGKMTSSGLKSIQMAKENGTWNALDSVEALIIPDDLKISLESNPPALENFEAFPKSVKRGILEWISNAKQLTTREKRITETVRLAVMNQRANQYKKDYR
jgi:uncharacterized protein YdeI (YjbR/CyaY-like superfamily)